MTGPALPALSGHNIDAEEASNDAELVLSATFPSSDGYCAVITWAMAAQ
jgi:hypothetical protein